MSLQAPLMFRKRQLAFKVETTYGTYEALTATEAGLKVADRELKIVSPVAERENSTGSLGNDQGVPEGAHTELTMTNYLTGKGASGLPYYADWWKSVGMALTGATFTTTSTQSNWKGLSALVNEDGRIKKARGLMGSCKLTFNAGQKVQLDWSHMGGWVEDPTDEAALTPITQTEAIPPIWGGTGSLTLNSSTDFKVNQLTLDLNTTPALREDPNSAGGFIGGWLGNIKPKITMDPEAMLCATQNWYATQRAGTQMNLVLVVGSAANNTMTITCTNLQLSESPTNQERNGKLVDALNFNVNGTVAIAYS